MSKVGHWGVLLLGLVSCGRRETPPERLPAQVTASAQEPRPQEPAPSLPTALAPAFIASASVSAGPAGGPWARCWEGFSPSSTPLRDVLRIALSCGPSNGMRQVSPVIEGQLGEGQVREQTVKLTQGQCVRAFAVGDAGIVGLRLVLRAPGGEVLADAGASSRWPVLAEKQPVCVRESGAYVVQAVAERGQGAFAMQTWLLP